MNYIGKMNKTNTLSFIGPSFKNKAERSNTCFITLVRNSELHGMIKSIQVVEKKFNSRFKNNWIFLNDEPFTEEFNNAITREIPFTVEFGLIPKEHWSQPDFIDKEKAVQVRDDMSDIIYSSSESYRHRPLSI